MTDLSFYPDGKDEHGVSYYTAWSEFSAKWTIKNTWERIIGATLVVPPFKRPDGLWMYGLKLPENMK